MGHLDDPLTHPRFGAYGRTLTLTWLWVEEVPAAALLPIILFDSYQAWTTLSITLKRASNAGRAGPCHVNPGSHGSSQDPSHTVFMVEAPEVDRIRSQTSASDPHSTWPPGHAAGTEEQRPFSPLRGEGSGVHVYVHTQQDLWSTHDLTRS